MTEKTAYPTPESPERASTEEQSERSAYQDAWNVIVHNDDETPFDFVIHTLSSVFMLSDELAEHIATTAHANGTAVVTIRPREEAKMLMSVALGRAKASGYPLKFTLEPS